MKLKKIFNSFFKKQNTSNCIASFGDLVKMPQREDFNDELSNLKIDELKAFFRDILNKNKTLTSTFIHDEHLQQELDMNLDLLMNISFDKEIEPINDEEKRIRSLIIYSKLKLYLNKIIELETGIKYRLIALKELEKESFGFSIKNIFNKKRVIKEEINNLLGILCVLKNQRYAIFNKVNACSTEFKTINNTDEEIKISGSKYLTNRLKRLKGYADILLRKEEINNVNSFDEPINQIAALERYFEIYSYTHNNEINDISSTLKDSSLKQVDGKYIEEIESKLRVHDEFGKTNISMDDLFNLYKLKFNYKIININQNNDNPIFLSLDNDERDFTEYSMYGQIVMEMIEDLIIDKDHILKNQFDTNKDFFWESFRALLNPNYNKDLSSMYDINTILSDNLVLAFLLAAYHNNLAVFFRNFTIKTPEPMLSIIELEKRIPLDTFFKIYAAELSTYYAFTEPLSKLESYINSDDFIRQYPSLKAMIDVYPTIHLIIREPYGQAEYNYYHIPEGIVSLYKKDELIIYPKRLCFIDKFITPGFSKYVYTPKSLKELNTNAFSRMIIQGLVLNEGLKRLYVDPTSNLVVTYMLCIPSTLEVKDSKPLSQEREKKSVFGFNSQFLDELNFTNFKESIILNDKKYLKVIFSKIIFKEHFFRTNIKRIILWDGDYNAPKSITCIIKNDEIKKIIDDVASKHPKIYRNALKYGYEKEFFISLIVDRFISIVYKKSGFTLCENKDNQKRVLKK